MNPLDRRIMATKERLVRINKQLDYLFVLYGNPPTRPPEQAERVRKALNALKCQESKLRILEKRRQDS